MRLVSEGRLVLYEPLFLARVLPTQRGSVRRLKFGPGKGNTKMVALFSDGLDIWDAQDASFCVGTSWGAC